MPFCLLILKMNTLHYTFLHEVRILFYFEVRNDQRNKNYCIASEHPLGMKNVHKKKVQSFFDSQGVKNFVKSYLTIILFRSNFIKNLSWNIVVLRGGELNRHHCY